MTDLLARLQAATQGSAELDAEVLRAAGWRHIITPGTEPDGYLVAPTGRPHFGRHYVIDSADCPHPSRSLDAIDALIEARGWRWGRDALGRAVLYVGNFAPTVCDGPNFILALNYLFVRALETAA